MKTESRAISTAAAGLTRRLLALSLNGALGIALSACVAQTGGPQNPEPPFEDQSMSEPARQPETAVAPAPQQAAIDPGSLEGMTGARITTLFGTPVFVRRDPPGEFWRYRGETCVLELYFYLQNGTQRVDHIETRNATGTPQNQATCIAKLRKPPGQT